MIKLMFLPSNQAWAFVRLATRSILRLEHEPSLFATKGDAIAAAARKRLVINRKTGVLS